MLFLPLSLLFGQEEQKELQWDILGELSIAYGIPSSYGNNFLAEGYDLRNATNITANVLESPKWLIGGQWSFVTREAYRRAFAAAAGAHS